MAEQLEVITDMTSYAERMSNYGELENPEPLLVQAGNLLVFAENTFPDTPLQDIYALRVEREPYGRGAHFDVYQQLVDASIPWIGVYNLAGRATIRTTVLSPELSKAYFEEFPESNNDAYDARRHFAAIAFAGANAHVKKGMLEPGTGLVLPQRQSGPHIVHEIVPEFQVKPGRFLKLVVPSKEETSRDILVGERFSLLHLMVERMFGGSLVEQNEKRENVQSVSEMMPPMAIILHDNVETRQREQADLRGGFIPQRRKGMLD